MSMAVAVGVVKAGLVALTGLPVPVAVVHTATEPAPPPTKICDVVPSYVTASTSLNHPASVSVTPLEKTVVAIKNSHQRYRKEPLFLVLLYFHQYNLR